MKILLYSFLGLFLLYLLVIVGMYLFQDRFVFQATFLPADHQFQFENAHFEEIFLTKSNGKKINALHFKVENPKGIVLYFHGNKDNLERWGNMHVPFTDCHYEVLMIDYSGYGKSEGKASDENLHQDAVTVYEWARKYYEIENVVLYGRSLGAAIASQLATKEPARVLILETPFNNLEAIFRHRTMLPRLPFPLRNKLSNMETIPKVNYPVHIFHGTQDWVVPYRCAVQLKQVLQEKDNFITLEGGTHHNLSKFRAYQEKLGEILGCNVKTY